MTRSGLVQISVRGLGIRNIGSEVAGQHEIPPSQGIREVGVMVAARQVATLRGNAQLREVHWGQWVPAASTGIATPSRVVSLKTSSASSASASFPA